MSQRKRGFKVVPPVCKGDCMVNAACKLCDAMDSLKRDYLVALAYFYQHEGKGGTQED